MSEVITTSPEIPERIPEATPVPGSNGAPLARAPRFKVTVHRLDGGLEQGDSDERALSPQGYPIYNPADADRPRVIPALAASPSLLEMQFVDMWAAPAATPQPQRRRSDIVEAAARSGRDLGKLANDFRDRMAMIRDVGLTTGDTLAFSRAVRSHLDRFLAEDEIELSSQEKSALADIILRAAVGYGPLDGLLHDRSLSEIMVNGPDQVFIERRGVLSKADVRFEDENQLLETIRRMVATTGRHIDGLNPMVDARLPDGSRVNAIIRPAAIH